MGIEGRVDRWSVRHGVEVGGGPVRCDDALGEVATRGRAQRRRTGITPLGGPVGLHELHRPSGPIVWKRIPSDLN
jgi:hypothetical protein